MQEISLDVILRAVLGLSDPDRRQLFKRGVLALMGSLRPSFMFFPALRRPLGGLSAWARFKRVGSQLTALFEQELRDRRLANRASGDILTALLAARQEDGSPLSDEDLLAQLMSLIAAGHETTASALAWALHHIHRDRRVKGLLLDELGHLGPGPFDPGSVAALPYLEAVCHETLRLQPVAPLIGRTLRRPLNLQGHELPVGSAVGIGIINVHQRADLYPEPQRFLPERFLGRELGRFEYLPFGGGARRCLGAAFAMLEMKLVLATMMRMDRLRLVDRGPVRAVLRNTTVGPAGGIPMRLV